jgi:phosphatidate cytidylyltransferase
MITRILSALVMAPIAIAAVWLGTPYFEALVIIVGLIAALEWYRLLSDDGFDGLNFIWLLCGLFYIALPCVIVIWLRNLEPLGFQIIIWFFAVIWATDIGAYFSGKIIGGPKLAPKISPNKTWAGFFGGILFAVVTSLILSDFSNLSSVAIALPDLIAASIFLSVVGQLGDLFESWVKRKLRVKDSGFLIPGHGGVLDRIDAILLAAPVAGLITMFFQIGDVSWK